MSLENVKAFYKRLAIDTGLRARIQSATGDRDLIAKEAGYTFTPEEFEAYTEQLLNSSSSKGELTELDERELEAIFGGVSSYLNHLPILPQTVYGVTRPLNFPPETLFKQ